MREGRELFEIYFSDGHVFLELTEALSKAAQLIASGLGYKSFEELKPMLNPDKAMKRIGEEERKNWRC